MAEVAKIMAKVSKKLKTTNYKDDLAIGYNFEGLRRELLSRKYSYKTVKGYLYYNRDFLNFTGKNLKFGG